MSQPRSNVRIHPTAEVSAAAIIGEGTAIWQQTQVREGAQIGCECNIGKCVYIGAGVVVGNRCKVENHASLHEGIELEDGVFIGPHVVLTNDRLPRAINPDGSRKGPADWVMGHIHIGYGAAVGAGSIVLPDVTIGRFAMVGAGSVVTRDVPAHALVLGNPARRVGYVCSSGHRLQSDGAGICCCPTCGEQVDLGPTDPRQT